MNEAGGDDADRVAARRERLGYTKTQLADMAGVDRGTLADIEAGGGTPVKRAQVLRTLAEKEAELGVSSQTGDGDLMEIEASGNFDVRIVVRGPVRDAQALEASLDRLMSRMMKRDDDQPGKSDDLA